MILHKKQIAQMEVAALPLMEFLSKFHPHVQVIVTANSAELTEGVANVKNNRFIKD